MIDHLIEPQFCSIPDQKTAQKKFKQKRQKNDLPIPYLHTYKDSNLRCISWIVGDSQKEDARILPAFGTRFDAAFFYEEEYRIPLREGSFFRCQGDFFFIIKDPSKGLCIKQIAIICSKSILEIFSLYFALDEFDFELCKVYQINQEHSFIGYVWSGYKQDDEHYYRAILPVFIEDFPRIEGHDILNLHYIPLNVGQTIMHQNNAYIVKQDDSGDIYIDSFAKIL